MASLRASSGAAYSRLLSVGSYRPDVVRTNADVCMTIDSSDEWILERSGIRERRWARPDQSVADLAFEAGRSAIARSGIAPERIGMVLVATVSHPYPTPSVAAEIAERLGAVNAAATDLSAACAGFCYGVALGDSLIRSGAADYVLLVGVEKLSDWTDVTDRGTAFIFADGAGAVVMGPSDEPAIGPVVWGAEGDHVKAINMTQSLVEYRDHGGEFPTLTMQGQTVFRWAVGEMSKVSQQALDAAGITTEDLDAFLPHQANMRITDALVKAIKLPTHVPVARDIEFTGNTSAASIPLAMDRMLAAGEIPYGGTALMIGFGAGLVYASQVAKLPPAPQQH